MTGAILLALSCLSSPGVECPERLAEANALAAVPAFDAYFGEARRQLLESDYLADLAELALLSKEHLLLLGPPGTAKSMAARLILRHILGSEYFEIQMTSETPLQDLVGPIDYKTLTEKNRYRRQLEEGMVLSDFVFVDEIFDSRVNALRHLLQPLVESEYQQGRERTASRIQSVFGATNHYLSEVYERAGDDRPKAVVDRFAFLAFVAGEFEELASSVEVIRRAKRKGGMPAFKAEELKALQAIVQRVEVPRHVAALLALVSAEMGHQTATLEQAALKRHRELERQGEEASPPYRATKYHGKRTLGKAGAVLQAMVAREWMRGQGNRALVAGFEDVKALERFFALNGPRDAFVEKLLKRTTNPHERNQLQTILDERKAFRAAFQKTHEAAQGVVVRHGLVELGARLDQERTEEETKKLVGVLYAKLSEAVSKVPASVKQAEATGEVIGYQLLEEFAASSLAELLPENEARLVREWVEKRDASALRQASGLPPAGEPEPAQRQRGTVPAIGTYGTPTPAGTGARLPASPIRAPLSDRPGLLVGYPAGSIFLWTPAVGSSPLHGGSQSVMEVWHSPQGGAYFRTNEGLFRTNDGRDTRPGGSAASTGVYAPSPDGSAPWSIGIDGVPRLGTEPVADPPRFRRPQETQSYLRAVADARSRLVHHSGSSTLVVVRGGDSAAPGGLYLVPVGGRAREAKEESLASYGEYVGATSDGSTLVFIQRRVRDEPMGRSLVGYHLSFLDVASELRRANFPIDLPAPIPVDRMGDRGHALSADGKWLYVGGPSGIGIIDMEAKRYLRTIETGRPANHPTPLSDGSLFFWDDANEAWVVEILGAPIGAFGLTRDLPAHGVAAPTLRAPRHGGEGVVFARGDRLSAFLPDVVPWDVARAGEEIMEILGDTKNGSYFRTATRLYRTSLRPGEPVLVVDMKGLHAIARDGSESPWWIGVDGIPRSRNGTWRSPTFFQGDSLFSRYLQTVGDPRSRLVVGPGQATLAVVSTPDDTGECAVYRVVTDQEKYSTETRSAGLGVYAGASADGSTLFFLRPDLVGNTGLLMQGISLSTLRVSDGIRTGPHAMPLPRVVPGDALLSRGFALAPEELRLYLATPTGIEMFDLGAKAWIGTLATGHATSHPTLMHGGSILFWNEKGGITLVPREEP